MSTHSLEQASEISSSTTTESSPSNLPDDLSETESEDSGLSSSLVSTSKDGDVLRWRREVWKAPKVDRRHDTKTGSCDSLTSGHVGQEGESLLGDDIVADDGMKGEAQHLRTSPSTDDNVVSDNFDGWTSTGPGLKRHRSCQVLDSLPNSTLELESGLSRRSTESNLEKMRGRLQKSQSLSMSELRLVKNGLPEFCEAMEVEPAVEDDAGQFTTVHYKSPDISRRTSRHQQEESGQSLREDSAVGTKPTMKIRRDENIGKVQPHSPENTQRQDPGTWRTLPQVQGQNVQDEEYADSNDASEKVEGSCRDGNQPNIGDASAEKETFRCSDAQQAMDHTINKLNHAVEDSSRAGKDVTTESTALRRQDQEVSIVFSVKAQPNAGVSPKPSEYSDTDVVAMDVINPQACPTTNGTSIIAESHSTLDGGRIVKEVQQIGLQPALSFRRPTGSSIPAQFDGAEPRFAATDIDLNSRTTPKDEDSFSGYIESSGEQTESIPYLEEAGKCSNSTSDFKDVREHNASIPDFKEAVNQYDSVPDFKEAVNQYDSVPDFKEAVKQNDSVPDFKEAVKQNDSVSDVKKTGQQNDSLHKLKQFGDQSDSIHKMKDGENHDSIPKLKESGEYNDSVSVLKEAEYNQDQEMVTTKSSMPNIEDSESPTVEFSKPISILLTATVITDDCSAAEESGDNQDRICSGSLEKETNHGIKSVLEKRARNSCIEEFAGISAVPSITGQRENSQSNFQGKTEEAEYRAEDGERDQEHPEEKQEHENSDFGIIKPEKGSSNDRRTSREYLESFSFAEDFKATEPEKCHSWSGNKSHSCPADDESTDLDFYNPSESQSSSKIPSFNKTSSPSGPKPSKHVDKSETSSNTGALRTRDTYTQTSKSLEDLFVAATLAARTTGNLEASQSSTAAAQDILTGRTRKRSLQVEPFSRRDSEKHNDDPKQLIQTMLDFVRKALTSTSSEMEVMSPMANEMDSSNTEEGSTEDSRRSTFEIQNSLTAAEEVTPTPDQTSETPVKESLKDFNNGRTHEYVNKNLKELATESWNKTGEESTPAETNFKSCNDTKETNVISRDAPDSKGEDDAVEEKEMSCHESEDPPNVCSKAAKRVETIVKYSENESDKIHNEPETLGLEEEVEKPSDDLNELLSVAEEPGNLGIGLSSTDVSSEEHSQIDGAFRESSVINEDSYAFPGKSSEEVGSVKETQASSGKLEVVAETPPTFLPISVPEQDERFGKISEIARVSTRLAGTSEELNKESILSIKCSVKSLDSVSQLMSDSKLSDTCPRQVDLQRNSRNLNNETSVLENNSAKRNVLKGDLFLGSGAESTDLNQFDPESDLEDGETAQNSLVTSHAFEHLPVKDSVALLKENDSFTPDLEPNLEKNQCNINSDSLNEISIKPDTDPAKSSGLEESPLEPGDSGSVTPSEPAMTVPKDDHSDSYDCMDSKKSFAGSEKSFTGSEKPFPDFGKTTLRSKGTFPVFYSQFDLPSPQFKQKFDSSQKLVDFDDFYSPNELEELLTGVNYISEVFPKPAEEQQRSLDELLTEHLRTSRLVDGDPGDSQDIAGSHPDAEISPPKLLELRYVNTGSGEEQNPATGEAGSKQDNNRIHNILNVKRMEDKPFIFQNDDVVNDVISVEGDLVEDIIIEENNIDDNVTSTGNVANDDATSKEADDADDVNLEGDVISKLNEIDDETLKSYAFLEDYSTDNVLLEPWTATTNVMAPAMGEKAQNGQMNGYKRDSYSSRNMSHDISGSTPSAAAVCDVETYVNPSASWHRDPHHTNRSSVSAELEVDAKTNQDSRSLGKSGQLGTANRNEIEATTLDPLFEERQSIYASLLPLQYLSQEWTELVQDHLNYGLLQTDQQLLELVEKQPSRSPLVGLEELSSHPTRQPTSRASHLGQTSTLVDSSECYRPLPTTAIPEAYQSHFTMHESYRSPDTEAEHSPVLQDSYHPRDRYRLPETTAKAYHSPQTMREAYHSLPVIEQSYQLPEARLEIYHTLPPITKAFHSQMMPPRYTKPRTKYDQRDDEYRPKFRTLKRKRSGLNPNKSACGKNWVGTRTDIEGVAHDGTKWNLKETGNENGPSGAKSHDVFEKRTTGPLYGVQFCALCSMTSREGVSNASKSHYDFKRKNTAGPLPGSRRCCLCLKDHMRIETKQEDRNQRCRPRWMLLKPSYLQAITRQESETKVPKS